MDLYYKENAQEYSLISHFQSDITSKNETFHLLMKPYLPILFNRCVYKVSDRTAAEDLVQDILIRVYNALPKYRHDALFKTWLFTITDNVCYSFLSRNYIYKSRVVTFIVLDNIKTVNDSNIDLEIDCKKIISSLSINEQEIIKLRFYKDLSLDEISNILRITISACKMRLYRALQSLSLLII